MSYTKLDDELAKFGNILSWEFLRALKADVEALYASMPVGEICPIMTNVPGVTVDPNIWQECNGSAITCPTSPLRGTSSSPRYTPDLRDRYLKMPTSFGNTGQMGGSHTYTGFGHNHGGVTGEHTAARGADWTGDGFFNVAEKHSHAIAWATGSAYNMEPRHFMLKLFMKIQ